MDEKDIAITVNGTEHELRVESRRLLVHVLREQLDLTGTHIGCDTGNCGACTVLVDGEPVKSCLQFAVQADGSEVDTVEGMAEHPDAGLGESDLHPVQEGFRQMHGLQCGFCTPGMIMAGAALLEENPDPTDEAVRERISGNLCRCTGYQNIVKSVQYAADVLNGREPPDSPLESEEAGAAEPATDGGTLAGCGCGADGGGCGGPDGGAAPGPDLDRDYPTAGGSDDERPAGGDGEQPPGGDHR